MTTIAAASILLGLAGCAGMQGQVKKAIGMDGVEIADYPFMDFVDTFDLPAQGAMVPARTIAIFNGTEEMLLDLPAPYDFGWIRLDMSAPSDESQRTINVVAPKRYAKMIKGLRKGDPVELLVTRMPRPDSLNFDVASASRVILRIDQMMHPGQNAGRITEKGAKSVNFVSRLNSKDYLRLDPDGTFLLSGKGVKMRGSFQVRGETVSLTLPNGRVADATLIDGILTDPDGVEWVQR